MPRTSSAANKTSPVSSMPNLKQGTLSFASTKRTGSALNGKSQQNTEKGKYKRVETSAEVESDEKHSKQIETSSSEEGDAATEVTLPVKRTRASTKARLPSEVLKQPPPQPSQSEQLPKGVEREHLDVEDKAGRYRKYYNEVRSKMGYMDPIHPEGQNKIHQMLRFFDMSYEFGPCIGITRLERWERAETLGLNPPVEVQNILLTKEGMERLEYIQCVLDNVDEV